MADDIPSEVKEFIRHNVVSVGHLDVLLLLARDPERVWIADQVASELRTNQTLAEKHLRDLASLGLARAGYMCTSEPALREKIERLAGIYHLRRPSVIHFIYSQPMDRIRDFADAFKIKKD
jgi:predicted ArsR family transcriptional regulator